jgi:hypothetical protein
MRGNPPVSNIVVAQAVKPAIPNASDMCGNVLVECNYAQNETVPQEKFREAQTTRRSRVARVDATNDGC